MQTATSETESKFRDLSICVHHYTLRAPCPKGQGKKVRFSEDYGACPQNETCAFSEGLAHHCTGAGGVGYEKVLDWPPWKEPLPTRAWLTTP